MAESNTLLDHRVSETIRLARVLCIFFMMLVHVPPGFDGYAEAAKQDPSVFFVVQTFLTGVLGRSSVPLLSIISGYLAVSSLGRYGFSRYASSRFATLYAPIIFWNGLLLLFSIAALEAFGVSTSAYEAVADFGSAKMFYGAVLSADYSGITVSLRFLRDLFVCGLLLPLLIPPAQKMPVVTLLVLVVASSAGLLEPLIYRPAIIQFFFIGVIVHFHKAQVTQITRYSIHLYCALVIVTILHMMLFFGNLEQSLFTFGPTDVFVSIKQLVVALSMWCFCFWLIKFNFTKRIVPYERVIFFAYLSHMFVFGICWFVWQKLIGVSASSSLYSAFFIGAPLGLLLVAPACDRVTALLPVFLQILIKGKATRAPVKPPNKPQVAEGLAEDLAATAAPRVQRR